MPLSLRVNGNDTQSEKTQGFVTIINTEHRAVSLPTGTEFIAKNFSGTEVRFTLDEPTTIPPAVTISQPAGSSTTYGQVQVIVIAQQSGANSNIDRNTITTIVRPGNTVINNNTSLIIRHEAIAGGSHPNYAFSKADALWLQDKVTTEVFDEGLRHLRIQANQYGNALNIEGIQPDQNALKNEKNVEFFYDPPLNDLVKLSIPNISITARTRFTALATPAKAHLTQQLEATLPQYLQQRNMFSCRDRQSSISLYHWSWDGTQLIGEGMIHCFIR